MPKKRIITDEEIRKLVIERLKTLPSGKHISIGNEGSFTKRELIKQVAKRSHLGKKIVRAELEFLRALKKGEFFNE
jgi:hypothetical protein